MIEMNDLIDNEEMLQDLMEQEYMTMEEMGWLNELNLLEEALFID